MASDVPAVSGLAPEVPKIIITQPSPKRDEEGRVPRTPFSNANAVYPPSTTSENEPPFSSTETELSHPSTSENETVIRIPRNTSVTASEGFLPGNDCTEINVEDEDKLPTPTHSAVSENVTGNDPIGRSFRDRLRCFRCPENGIDPVGLMWKLVFLFNVFLLGVFIFATVVGSFYIGKCPFRAEVPYFIFMIGIAGCMVLVCRLKMLICNNDEYITLWIIATCGTVIILLLFFAELTSWPMSPSFHYGDMNYCAEKFYQITLWFNWFGLFLMLLMGLFYAQKLFLAAELDC